MTKTSAPRTWTPAIATEGYRVHISEDLLIHRNAEGGWDIVRNDEEYFTPEGKYLKVELESLYSIRKGFRTLKDAKAHLEA